MASLIVQTLLCEEFKSLPLLLKVYVTDLPQDMFRENWNVLYEMAKAQDYYS